eukprot:7650284-Pyramimonas_sp.AAC.1
MRPVDATCRQGPSRGRSDQHCSEHHCSERDIGVASAPTVDRERGVEGCVWHCLCDSRGSIRKCDGECDASDSPPRGPSVVAPTKSATRAARLRARQRRANGLFWTASVGGPIIVLG